MSFNTVQEITHWRPFTDNNTVYDLSHLNVAWIEYTDHQNNQTYRFIVTYGLHCFTKDTEVLSIKEKEALMYHTPRESRPFNLQRYQLSKQLPQIVESFGKPDVLVCHAGYGNYAVVSLESLDGKARHYFVVFKAFREMKKLRLHIISAYPLETRPGKCKKVRFFTIAANLLKNKLLPHP